MVSVIELHTISHSRLDCGSDHQINTDQSIITAAAFVRREGKALNLLEC